MPLQWCESESEVSSGKLQVSPLNNQDIAFVQKLADVLKYFAHRIMQVIQMLSSANGEDAFLKAASL